MPKSVATAYAFTVNYILGVGILSLPVAVTSAGTVLSSVMFFVIAFISVVFMIALAEVSGRGTEFLKWKLWRHKHPEFRNMDTSGREFSSTMVSVARTDVETKNSSHTELLSSNSNIHSPDNRQLLPTSGISPEKKGPNIQHEASSSLQSSSHSSVNEEEHKSSTSLGNDSVDGERVLLGNEKTEGKPKSKRGGILCWKKKGDGNNKLDEELSDYDPADGPTFLFSDKHVIEVTALMHLFLGLPGEIIYFVSLCAYMFCGLWNYSCVFTQSLVLSIPVAGLTKTGECLWSNVGEEKMWNSNCEGAYYLFNVIYMVLVSLLSCLDMSEQKVIQICLTVLRFVAVLIMCVTSLIALYQSPFNTEINDGTKGPPYLSDAPLADFGQFGKLLTMALFAFMTHHSTPGILGLLGKDGANKSGLLFNLSFYTIACIYTLLSVCISIYFGSDVNAVATMMWYNYNGKDFSGDKNGSIPWWASVLSYIVVLFPPIDLLSAFPLNAITVGNSLRMFINNKVTEVREKKGLPVPNLKRRWFVIVCRIFVCVVPCVLSMVVRDVEKIVEVTGLFAFVIVFFGPTAVLLASRRKCRVIWGEASERTPFTTWMTNKVLIIVLCSLSVAAFVYTVVSFFINGL